ncbi:hypothetical protein N7478_008053 [Penicillium angulare]|uniref:uncharacterized protein n=1 Tax=Penicillium angulare TaxID=116970 RepID=UPI002540CB5E|nr:uncharacterized protein N7478_008053 [Penicillium angulare]KAJ5272928.1 hypothetical protein N7478_008053 [Penicillium angulare]
MDQNTPPNTQPLLHTRRGLLLLARSHSLLPARSQFNIAHSSPAELSSHQTVGTPLTVPQAPAGDEELPPGEWAAHAKQLPWQVTRTGGFVKTQALELLIEAPSRREPAQRSSTQYTGKKLDERVSTSAANAELILMQVVGSVAEQECKRCLKRNGPWAHCVRFHDITRTVTACANCQWNGNKKRCDFYQPPVGAAENKRAEVDQILAMMAQLRLSM